MAQRTPGTGLRLQRLIAFFAIGGLAAATAVGFGRVFAGQAGTLKVLAAGVASAAVAAALERRSLLLATAASTALMIVAVGLLVFPTTTWHGLPTLDTLRAAGEQARLVGAQARVQIAPTLPLKPLLLAAVVAIWAAIFSSHALAVRAGSPLLALLPPLALLAFADTVLEETSRPGFGLLFLLGALAVVFVDGLRRVQRWGPVWTFPGTTRRTATGTRGGRKVAALAVAAAAVAPAFLPGFGSKGLIDLNGANSDTTAQFDPQVAIAAQLDPKRRPEEILTVRAEHPSFWRLGSLDFFSGTSWRATTGDQVVDLGPSGTGVDTYGQRPLKQTFSVTVDLTLPGVPVAYPPLDVQVPSGGLRFDTATLAVFASDAATTLTAGTKYTATSNPAHPPVELLNAVAPPAATSLSGSRWTQVPPTLPADIHDLAVRWTAGADTMYLRVLAIQQHLTDITKFSYDPHVKAADDQLTLEDFLYRTRAGICQQFASAMAVMLRTLGIPARVAIGFAPGTDNHDGTFSVMSTDYHSWVEVDFGPTYGWLPFDPTPGGARYTAGPYAIPLQAKCKLGLAKCPVPGGDAPPTGTGRFHRSPHGFARRIEPLGKLQGPRPIAQKKGGRLPAGRILLILTAIGVVVLLVVPPARALRRKVKLRRAGSEPRRLILATYEVFAEQAADLGLGRGPGETLEEYRRRLAGSGLLSNGDLDRLTRIAVRAAYAVDDPEPGEAQIAGNAARETIRELRKGTPIARRLAGIYRLDPNR